MIALIFEKQMFHPKNIVFRGPCPKTFAHFLVDINNLARVKKIQRLRFPVWLFLLELLLHVDWELPHKGTENKEALIYLTRTI